MSLKLKISTGILDKRGGKWSNKNKQEKLQKFDESNIRPRLHAIHSPMFGQVCF